MYCPHDVNTGFIQLVGPILQQDLNSISIKSYPLSISFAPRTTPPTLIGNRFDESTENTCTYKGQRFSLVDVQICSVTNQGYMLPGQTTKPVGELILSFSANRTADNLSTLSGILLCVPIFDTGNISHADYLNQLIDPDIPSCDYTHLTGSEYVGDDYKKFDNTNLTNCIRSCCDDINCLAYTFKNGSCHLKNTIPSLNKTTNPQTISGTVNHSTSKKNSNNQNNTNKKNGVPNLETIFYEDDNDISQSSFAYKTCFESIDNNNIPTSKSLYIVVFPNGIHLSQSGFQQILLQLNGNLKPYMIPPVIRGGDSTLRNYQFNDEGNKVPTITSQDGIIYSTPISSCTDEFKTRFEYFTLPPRLPISRSTVFNAEQCPYYKTTQYKCMPFNQLKDLSGAYVIPGNKTLDTILYEQEKSKQLNINDINIQTGGLSTEQIEGMIAGVAGIGIAVVIAIYIGSKISKYA